MSTRTIVVIAAVAGLALLAGATYVVASGGGDETRRTAALSDPAEEPAWALYSGDGQLWGAVRSVSDCGVGGKLVSDMVLGDTSPRKNVTPAPAPCTIQFGLALHKDFWTWVQQTLLGTNFPPRDVRLVRLASPRFQIDLDDALVTQLRVPALSVADSGKTYLEASILAESAKKTEPCCASSITVGSVDAVVPSSLKVTLDGAVVTATKTGDWSASMNVLAGTAGGSVQLSSGRNDVADLTLVVPEAKASTFDKWLDDRSVEKSLKLQLSNGASKLLDIGLTKVGLISADWAAPNATRAYELYAERAELTSTP